MSALFDKFLIPTAAGLAAANGGTRLAVDPPRKGTPLTAGPAAHGQGRVRLVSTETSRTRASG